MIKLRYRHWLPRLLRVQGITLYPYILLSARPHEVPASVLRHEMIHVRQVRRLGWLRFYASYLVEYARLRFSGMGHAASYLGISHEREAYQNQDRIELSRAELAELSPRRGDSPEDKPPSSA